VHNHGLEEKLEGTVEEYQHGFGAASIPGTVEVVDREYE